MYKLVYGVGKCTNSVSELWNTVSLCLKLVISEV